MVNGLVKEKDSILTQMIGELDREKVADLLFYGGITKGVEQYLQHHEDHREAIIDPEGNARKSEKLRKDAEIKMLGDDHLLPVVRALQTHLSSDDLLPAHRRENLQTIIERIKARAPQIA